MKQINIELAQEENYLRRYRLRKAVLSSVENLDGESRSRRQSSRSEILKPDFKILKDSYNEVRKILNAKYPECLVKTHSEFYVLKQIRENTNLDFLQSVWLGNRNVDLFCPAIGSLHPPIRKNQPIHREKIMRGLVVEVNGGIHNNELKGKKDSHKSEFLHELGIGHTVIENDAMHSPQIRNLIGKIKNTPRLDSRARQRLWRKIYVITLAFHVDDQVLLGLYGKPFLEMLETNQPNSESQRDVKLNHDSFLGQAKIGACK